MKNLTDKAMLVSLSISRWTARKYDKRISDEVARDHNATSDAGRYNKVLIAGEALSDINKAVRISRDHYFQNTLPWSDAGTRILPATGYIDFMNEQNKYRTQFENAVAAFTANYPQYVKDAKKRLNGMFIESDYPSAFDIDRKFGMSVVVMPLPDAKDFRVKLGEDEIDRIRNDIEHRVNETLEDAMRDLWGRLYKVVFNLSERLSDPDKIFQQSLISNIADVISVIPKLNVMNDAKLSDFAKECRANFANLNPDDLRNDKFHRASVAVDADEILKRMADYI